MAYDGYGGNAATGWERTILTTLPMHLRDVEKAVLRNYQIGAMIQSKGKVLYNQSGEGLTWPVQYKIHQSQGDLGEGARQFRRTNQWKKAKLDYRGFNVTDSISRRERLSNRGDEAIVNFSDNMIARLIESLGEISGPKYYIDGYLAGNETDWHGLLSAFNFSGTVDVTAGATLNTQRSPANVLDRLAWANGSYGGIVQSLGNYGGAQDVVTDEWPNGTASPQYDFWTPLIINYNSSAFNGTADTWAAQAVECLRYGLTHSSRNAGANAQITNVIMSRSMWIAFLAIYEPFMRIQVTQELPLRQLGFKDVVAFDGRELSAETACPSGNAFGLNFENIDLRCMTEQLFEAETAEYDPHTQNTDYVVSTLSNLRFPTPGRMVRWTNVTGAAA